MNGRLSDEQRRVLEKAERFRDLYQRGGITLAGVDHYDEFFHPDYQFTPAITEMGAQRYRGREGMRQWIADIEAVATDFTLTDIELRPVGEHQLLVLGMMHLTGRESGAAFDSEYGWCYRHDGDLILEGRAFLSHAEAERAAEEAEAEVSGGSAGA